MEQLWIQSELSEGPAPSAGLFQLVLHYTAIKKKKPPGRQLCTYHGANLGCIFKMCIS